MLGAGVERAAARRWTSWTGRRTRDWPGSGTSTVTVEEPPRCRYLRDHAAGAGQRGVRERRALGRDQADGVLARVVALADHLHVRGHRRGVLRALVEELRVVAEREVDGAALQRALGVRVGRLRHDVDGQPAVGEVVALLADAELERCRAEAVDDAHVHRGLLRRAAAAAARTRRNREGEHSAERAEGTAPGARPRRAGRGPRRSGLGHGGPLGSGTGRSGGAMLIHFRVTMNTRPGFACVAVSKRRAGGTGDTPVGNGPGAISSGAAHAMPRFGDFP